MKKSKNVVGTLVSISAYLGCYLYVFLLIQQSGCAPNNGVNADVGQVVSAAIVGGKITESVDKIGFSLDRLGTQADYLLEKNLRTLDLLAQSLAYQLQQETARNREFVSKELDDAASVLNDLVDNVQGGVLEIQDFAYLDVQNIINQLPLKKDLYLIRRIDGYGIQFQNEGSYSFRLLGNAFQPGRTYKILIDSVEVDANNVFGGEAANILRFSVPVKILNHRFTESEIGRTSIVIQCFDDNTEESFYEYSSDVLLLPKFPIRYQLREFYEGQKWSEQRAWQSFTRGMGPTGKYGRWNTYTTEVTIADPVTQRFTGNHRISVNGSHSWVHPPQYHDRNTKLRFNSANQCHDCGRTAIVEAEYQWLENITESRMLNFESDNKNEGLLTYGTHFVTMSDKLKHYELYATYFNGKEVALFSDKNEDSGIKAKLSLDPKVTFRRLAVEIENPF